MDLAPVIDAFDVAAAGRPLALSIRRGRDVVLHRAAGMRADGRRFTTDTPVLLYSVAKAAVGLTAVVLAARGDLDLDAPVARYWPAFGAHGKDLTTVAQALSHGAAVPAWPTGMTLEGLRDIDGACAALADQPPWWPIGEPGEHVYTFGHLISGIVHGRVGHHVDQVWAEEVAGPLAIDLTMTPHVDAEPMVDPGGVFLDRMRARAQNQAARLWQPLELCDAAVVNTFRAEDPSPVWAPAVLGWAGADAVARLYAFWSGAAGHLPGKPAVWQRSRRPHTVGTDHVMGAAFEWALGTAVEGAMWGMGGIGGCAGWHDDRSGLSIGIVGPVLGMGDALDDLEAALDALSDPAGAQPT